MMPDRAETHEERGDQLATLAAVIHERATDPALGALIAAAEAEKLADERELACVREARKASDRMTKLPSELAETKALASRAEDLSEQLGTVEAELAALKLEPAPSPSGDLESLFQDLETLTHERNRLAAEVASLKASGTRPDSV
jgi:carboxypeptidase Taq